MKALGRNLQTKLTLVKFELVCMQRILHTSETSGISLITATT
jgi:ribosomal protein L33